MSDKKKIHLFVPGRLCLFGEHSDWAGMYRTVNSDIEKGQAIVSGVEQGIYATAEKADRFIITTSPDFPEKESWECEMDSSKLLEVDLESEKRETKSRVHVPETLEELEEALKKAKAQLESATNKVNLLTRALEEAKSTKE